MPRAATTTRARPRVIRPPATRLERLSGLPGRVAEGARLYRRTPPRLRRPEPVARAAVTAGATWCAVVFGALGALASRSTPALVLPAGVPVGTAFYAVAVLGAAAGAVFWTRRTRVGLRLLAAAAVAGPAVAVAAVLTAH